MPSIKAYSAFTTAISPSGETLPDSIQWMPPGRHAITAVKEGEPFEMEIEVDEALAHRVAAMLQHYRDKAARAEGDLPFFDFNHNDAEASAHPLQMYWAGDDPKQGGIRARIQWTGAGADAIQRRTFRRFSPEFLTDDDKNIIGVGINMGGLVNRAAFRNIQPIWSRAGDPVAVPSCSESSSNPKHGTRNNQHATHAPMTQSPITPGDLAASLTQLTETVTTHGDALKRIQAMLAEAAKGSPPRSGEPSPEPKILELERALAAAAEAGKVAAKAQAKRAVADAAAQGKLPPQDKDFFNHLVDVFTANPEAGKILLARMPVNPALHTLVTAGAAGRTALSPAEPANQFAALVKARATQFNGDRSRAIDVAIDESPDLYKAWRDANGQPDL